MNKLGEYYGHLWRAEDISHSMQSTSKLECQYFLGGLEAQQIYNRLERYRVSDSRTQIEIVRELKQRIMIGRVFGRSPS